MTLFRKPKGALAQKQHREKKSMKNKEPTTTEELIKMLSTRNLTKEEKNLILKLCNRN